MRFLVSTVLWVMLYSTIGAQVKISEIYTGGNSPTGLYKNDWVELYNSSSNPVTMTNWSIQYNSTTGTNSFIVSLFSGTIAPYSFYLVQVGDQANSNPNGLNITPDAVGGAVLSFGGTGGKVALCNSNTALLPNSNLFSSSNLVDFIGYGSANQAEGSALSPVNISNSIQRKAFSTSTTTTMQSGGVDHLKGNGYDSNNNSSDLFIATPEPQTSASPAENPNSNAPSITSTPQTIDFGAVNVNSVSTAQPVTISATNLSGDVMISVSGSSTFTISKTQNGTFGTSFTYTLAELAGNQTYYVQFSPVSSGQQNGTIAYTSTGLTATSVTLIGNGFIPGASSFDFNTCTSTLSDGFTQFSVSGAQLWACSTFGRNNTNNTLDAPNGISMNGFANSQNNANEDWLISPSFSITNVVSEYPLLSFWSRTKFNGPSIELRISTNYTSGNPTTATWTPLNVTLPAQNSDIWTISDNIDLSFYKGQNVRLAFVYTSTTTTGARWTIDDLAITNSTTPPPPVLTASKSNLAFGSVPNLSINNDQFNLSGLRITAPVVLSTSLPFQISQDNINFSNSINLPSGVINNTSIPIYVRFAPTQINQNYTGTITISSAGANTITINLSGNTVDATQSLEVVCWNIEWFSDANGPTNDALQETNVLKILRQINADVYGLGEIVDTLALKRLVDSLGASDFGYYVGKYGSGVPDASSASYQTAQKLAYIYRKNMISPINFTPLFYTSSTTDTLYNYWASGRFPLMMEANVTIGSTTQPMTFVLIHAKAQNSDDAYGRRKKAARNLKNYLDSMKPNERVIIFGDLNDDLDQTIAGQSIAEDYPLSSYSVIISDSAKYEAITLPLSYAGLKSTVGFNDVIDHIISSNEMEFEYIGSSAIILKDLVEGLVTDFGNTTSDHYPVMARFSYQNAFLPVTFINLRVESQEIGAKIIWQTSNEKELSHFIVEKSDDGLNWYKLDEVLAKNTSQKSTYDVVDLNANKISQYYRIRAVEIDDQFYLSKVVYLNRQISQNINLYPNPTSDRLYLNINDQIITKLSILSANGLLIKVVNPTDPFIDVHELSQGLYYLSVEGNQNHQLFKFVKN